MRKWWRRFVSMSDRERARYLAKIAYVVIVLLLYALGGLSLYLRARYVVERPTQTEAAPTRPAAPGPADDAARTPTVPAPPVERPSLYPTITPQVTTTAKDEGTGALASPNST